MADQFLFSLICVTLLLVITLAAAIVGTRTRLRLAKRLLAAYKDEKKINVWVKTYGRRQRLFALVSLILTAGIFVAGALILSGIVIQTKLLIVILVTLLVLLIISGSLMLIDTEKLAK
jgi:hypothetical protein